MFSISDTLDVCIVVFVVVKVNKNNVFFLNVLFVCEFKTFQGDSKAES